MTKAKKSKKTKKESKNIFSRAVKYFSESKVELTKVTWPSRKEAVRLTFIVVVFSGAVAIFLGGIDYFLSKIMEFILSK